jgi:DNA-binding PadR family transcriptional regulator
MRETYSYALFKELERRKGFISHLKEHGMDVKSDIYNTVKALEKSGYIKVDVRVEGGRLKKYYSITKSGRGVLRQTKRVLMASMNSLMDILGS